MQLLACLALVVVGACGTKSSSEPPPASGSGAGSALVIRDQVVGANGHVVVLKRTAGLTEYRDILATVERTPGVVAAEPFVFVEVKPTASAIASIPMSLKGVDPQRVGRVLALGARMTAGTIAELARGEPPAIVLGDALARVLNVKVGDPLSLADAHGDGTAHVFRVAGLFHSGFAVYDEELAYTSLAAGQKLINRGDQVTAIELKLADIAQSGAFARRLENTLGADFQVMDWYELNQALFAPLFGGHRP